MRTNDRLIFLFGPTGVGKTELLSQLFASGYHIVNADSKQIYRHLDIGSAKPSKELRATIPHYLIDIKEPWESFSVREFVRLADEACKQIVSQGKTPLLCGGTAYYFKHFYYGMPPSPPSNPAVRNKIALEVQTNGLEATYKRLQSIDPLSAAKIHPSDSYRIRRALEVYETSGQILSSYVMPDKPRNGLTPLIIGLSRTPEELHQRIALRVRHMFASGLKEEVQQLLTMGATALWPGMQGIGYQEFFTAQEGEVEALIIRNSRRYAKRQMTFFRSLGEVNWVHPENLEHIKRLVDAYMESSVNG